MTAQIADPVLVNSTQYQTQAASLGPLALGPSGTGALQDYLSHITIVPASLSPGAVTVTDGTGSAITVFAGGTNCLLTLHPPPA